MPLPPAFLEELRSRLPLSEVAGKRIKLVRAGREYKACCPFHNEKSPSFTLNDAKAFFHCFGCGAHGDIIGFVMRHDRLAFPEAIEHLAAQAGLDVPRLSAEEVEKESQKKTLHQLCEAACVWFEQQLHTPKGRMALDYLKGRGLGEETINRFRLGYAPAEGGALIVHLKTQGFELEQIIEAGLARQPDDGRAAYSFFRDRVLFPVTDRRGRVVAFGGRILSGEGAKYINSPDNPLFHKGRLLYSLARAREAAPRGAPILVVEGYMDVIALVEAGFTAAVAPLGTALTEDQIEELWKLGGTAGDPILCFDGDSAGQRAAARAVERVLPRLGAGRSLRFAFLPDGQDPDDLIKAKGAAAMQSVVDSAIPLIDMIWRLESTQKAAATPEARAGVKKMLDERMALIADKTVQEYYKAEFKQRLDEAYGWGRTRTQKSPFVNNNKRLGKSPLPQPPNPKAVQQRHILLGLLRHPDVFEDLGEQIVTLDLRGALDKLWQAVVMALGNQPGLDPSGLKAYLCELGFADLLSHLLSDKSDPQSWVRDNASREAVMEGIQGILSRHREDNLRTTMRAVGQSYAADISEAGRARLSAMRKEFLDDDT